MPQPLKLKIELKNMPHKVIRKVLVPEDINMHQFHLVIQKAMGWMGGHLFEFSDKKWNGDIRAGIPSDFEKELSMMSPGSDLQDAHKISLKKDFKEHNDAKPFWYTYDFGDDWSHRISFQKVSKKQLDGFEGRPVCIEAVGKCPPEDVGGPWGYADFLEMIKDKNHPEREELMEWYGIDPGEEYDEMDVDLDFINQMLLATSKSKDWNSTEYNPF